MNKPGDGGGSGGIGSSVIGGPRGHDSPIGSDDDPTDPPTDSDEDKDPCVAINEDAAKSKQNLPTAYTNSWRYNSIAALIYDMRIAQWNVNVGDAVSNLTFVSGLGISVGSFRFRSLAGRTAGIAGIGLSLIGQLGSLDASRNQNMIAAYRARISQIKHCR